ncbi:MAG: hypothetical protein ACP5NA_03215 [Candidatus Acidulodesulfobacterium sp.]
MVLNSADNKFKASIDIGTNTIRCLIVNSASDFLRPDYVDMKIIRLGENFKKEGLITQNSINRLEDALKVYSEKIKHYGIKPENVVITGTSVLRDAPNAKYVKDVIFNEFGFNLEIISGEKEALITLKGISKCFDGINEFYSIDIGGGSTEYVCVKNGSPLWKYSLNMGVVHLTEEIIKTDPVSEENLKELENRIEKNLNKLKTEIKETGFVFKQAALFGTAGTATTLAMVDLNMKDYDRLKVHGYFVSWEKTYGIYKRFAAAKISDRLKIAGVEAGREDLVLAGAAIMLKSMDFLEVSGFTVSECGLLEGLVS